MNDYGVPTINFYGDIPSNITCGKRTFKTTNSRWSGSGVARRKQRNKSAQKHY